jgi:hypothetical protein
MLTGVERRGGLVGLGRDCDGRRRDCDGRLMHKVQKRKGRKKYYFSFVFSFSD